ncbi:flagellar hook-basal body protein [Bacillus rubiinfantis]|uniref:flagellar hook-basal body protein n=1 Tax=Bacillus rubiinfantis TaxID=1499680 RepID=UPI0005AAEBB2|nr:flagellar hook-basal body protein [Bacillus rubiinfantis]
MLRGLYSAASGMYSLERRQEALANNLANAQTPGYKKDDSVLRAFPNLLLSRINDMNEKIPASGAPQIPGQPSRVGELTTGVYLQERIPSFELGDIVQTEQPLDVAINDQNLPVQTINGRQIKAAAFFTVQLPDGTIGYSRNGKFSVDGNGDLVTSEGYRVLGTDGQPIQLTDSIRKEDVRITSDGQISVQTGGQQNVFGQIGIAVADNPQELRRLGGNVFQADNPLPNLTNPGEVTIQQGFIEQSNVDAGQTMSDMMTTIRGYEANQKVIDVYSQSLQQLYSVGKLNG